MKFLQQLKDLLWLAKNFRSQQAALVNRVKYAENLIREQTDLHVEFGYRGDCTIIVAGAYKDKEYIQTYRLGRPEFAEVIRLLQHLSKFAQVRTCDAPPELRAVISREVYF